MKVLKVRTICTATLEEEWLIAVDDDTAASIALEPATALDAIAGNGLHAEWIDVKDVNTSEEQDRRVLRVERVAG